MYSSWLALVWLVWGLPPEPSPSADPPAASAEARPPAPAAAAGDPKALAEYNRRRELTPNTAKAQWELALWCEAQGLNAEMLVHLGNVLKLDPKRAAAWEKLGFKKRHGRWVTDQQLKDEARQAASDKEWTTKLRKWHASVHGGPKQAATLEAMAGLTDPAAVPSIYAVYGRRSAVDQLIAVQLLGQILSPDASRGLAVLAVYGESAEVRARATQTLRQREPDEYLGLLVGLLTDVLKFEVQPVGDPGSPGILLVEGEQYSVRRFYAPPLPPNLTIQWGDQVTYDDQGLPIIQRQVGETQKAIVGDAGKYDLVEAQTPTVRISVGDNILQSQIGALNAKAQLTSDLRDIRAFNKIRGDFNEHVLDVARAAMGTDLGKDPNAWRLAAARRLGASDPDPKKPSKPTFDLVVPLAYQPTFAEPFILRQRYWAKADT